STPPKTRPTPTSSSASTPPGSSPAGWRSCAGARPNHVCVSGRRDYPFGAGDSPLRGAVITPSGPAITPSGKRATVAGRAAVTVPFGVVRRAGRAAGARGLCPLASPAYQWSAGGRCETGSRGEAPAGAGQSPLGAWGETPEIYSPSPAAVGEGV